MYVKKLWTALVCSLSLIPLEAAHIVGGEIEFSYLSDGMYRISVIQYFDQTQFTNPGPEGGITVYIYRNSDGQRMSTFNLFLVSQETVAYSNIECVIDELQTLKVVWSANVSLNPSAYDDPEGYYIAWERCCRNDDIRNIVNPDGTGMKYVLEIPPLMLNGKVFVNSSPSSFEPIRDYACVDQLFSFEFTGTDPDGDSLAYSLTTPLNSSSTTPTPTPQPKPHIPVLYERGFSNSNVIPGSPALSISNEGVLTVNPSETGLYVFSVLIGEYRDRIKIGETQRDFQILVVDGCEPPDPPVVKVDIPGRPGFDPETDILTYSPADGKCFDFLVSNVTPGEVITLSAEGVNFDGNMDEIFMIRQKPIGDPPQTLRVEVCIPDCPPLRDEPFIMDLIASDNACPLPQSDIVTLTVEVTPPPNELPVTSTSDKVIIRSVNSGIYSENITATDADNDEMIMSLFVEGLTDPGASGFVLEVINSEPGTINAAFSWDTDCRAFDFSSRDQFKVGLLIEDLDECMVPNPDTIFFDAVLTFPPNEDPEVTVDRAIPGRIELGSSLEFNATVFDQDKDDVSLRLAGGNFDPNRYGIKFEPSLGNTTATSAFLWNLECDAGLYEDGQIFELLFIGDDADECEVNNSDTLKAIVRVDYPPNEAPGFSEIERRIPLRVNEFNQIRIGAFDPEPGDMITLSFAEGVRQPASESLRFNTVSGFGSISSILEWQPECSLLRFDENSSLHDVVFQVSDNACPVRHVTTLKITFEIFDETDNQRKFLPPNVFTPNGDGINDVFSLSGNADPSQNLPINNCDNVFEYIVINNRSGNAVFESSTRDFIWSGGRLPAGVYYYFIKYSNSQFKGYIHLLR